MNAKFFGALLAAPLAAVSAMIMAAPASAAVFFNNGDLLNIGGGVKAPTSVGEHKFAKVGKPVTFAGIGSYGNFGIYDNDLTTGGFESFISNGTVLPGYEILSVDFTKPTDYLNNKEFLRVSNGVDSFKFIITEFISPLSASSFGYTTNVFKGVFKSLDDEVLGEGKGILSSQFLPNKNGSYSASFEVTKVSVPEPSALLGLGLMVGTVFIIRRRQEVSA
ncbi:MAG: hypothetical protein DCF15_02475 [Phormidesmis priestleyi]|uniref:Ice-binding protein C-terminal domain-containing protein n=1 Tax=Phormidesmis priestleyi TaxID=268141 RepID=A0A2W4XTL9_9CYAN|nr:MAG: hypothetical protein DCF15_02475 [Phormidesmis priestleyi]